MQLENHLSLAGQNSAFQVFSDCPKSYIYDKCDRIIKLHLSETEPAEKRFPSDTALLKALYLATFEATRRWTTTIRNWGQVYGELSIMYEGRLPD